MCFDFFFFLAWQLESSLLLLVLFLLSLLFFLSCLFFRLSDLMYGCLKLVAVFFCFLYLECHVIYIKSCHKGPGRLIKMNLLGFCSYIVVIYALKTWRKENSAAQREERNGSYNWGKLCKKLDRWTLSFLYLIFF